MGLETWLQWSAWFVVYVVLVSITTTITGIILCYPVQLNDVQIDGVRGVASYYRAIVSHVDVSVMLVFLFACILPCIASSFVVSAFFCKGKTLFCYD